MSKNPFDRKDMDMHPIKQVLGEQTPAVTPDALGRHRLMNALKQKFGPGYRNHPEATKARSHFESEFNHFRQLRKLKAESK